MAPRITTVEALLETVREIAERGDRTVFVPGGPVQPLLFSEAYDRAPELARGLTFVGVWIPGVNRIDWSGKHESARAETIFESDTWRESAAAGRTRVLPLHYTAASRWLKSRPIDAALFQVSPPNADGMCSLGPSADFLPTVLARPVFKAAQINPQLPPAGGGVWVPIDSFDVMVEQASDLTAFQASAPDEATRQVARNVVALIASGATVQIGVGSIGHAVLGALSEHRGLRIHSGLVTEPILDLLSCGAIAEAEGAVTTGVALGSPDFYRRLGVDPRVRFAPVDVTHDPGIVGSLDRFVAVNSAIEVDCFGQVNGETLAGRAVSSVGGLVDFLRGAAAAPDGLPIVALCATARGGAVSRIVPRLHGPVSAGRSDAGLVVTEHGVVDLRGLTAAERAQALIGLAAPAHRKWLLKGWRQLDGNPAAAA